MEHLPPHEKLFDDIRSKLQELSTNGPTLSREDIDYKGEMQKLQHQLDQERSNLTRVSTDLAKSLELNLKLQYEIEEVRSRSIQGQTDIRNENTQLNGRIKNLEQELELAQALHHEVQVEFAKLEESHDKKTEVLKEDLSSLREENDGLRSEFEAQRKKLEDFIHGQNKVMDDLIKVSEEKIVQLKVSLDKRTLEANDYHGRLQHCLSQLNIFKQENLALKEHVNKLTQLYNNK